MKEDIALYTNACTDCNPANKSYKINSKVSAEIIGLYNINVTHKTLVYYLRK